jgi:hypothetical protein
VSLTAAVHFYGNGVFCPPDVKHCHALHIQWRFGVRLG